MDNTETPLDTQGEDKLKKSGTRKLKLWATRTPQKVGVNQRSPKG
jgi:hypothetical protein